MMGEIKCSKMIYRCTEMIQPDTKLMSLFCLIILADILPSRTFSKAPSPSWELPGYSEVIVNL